MAEEEASVPGAALPGDPSPGEFGEEVFADLGDTRTYLVFRDGKRLYAIDAVWVSLLAESQRPVWVPSSSQLLLGVIHLHGQFIPLCDLQRILGIGAEEDPGPREMLESRMIVLEIDGRKLAFNVPTVLELVEVSEGSIRPMSGGSSSPSSLPGRGVLTGFFEEAAGAITVIDARKLLGALKAFDAA